MIATRMYIMALDELSSDSKNKYYIKITRDHFEKNKRKECMKYRIYYTVFFISFFVRSL